MKLQISKIKDETCSLHTHSSHFYQSLHEYNINFLKSQLYIQQIPSGQSSYKLQLKAGYIICHICKQSIPLTTSNILFHFMHVCAPIKLSQNAYKNDAFPSAGNLNKIFTNLGLFLHSYRSAQLKRKHQSSSNVLINKYIIFSH